MPRKKRVGRAKQVEISDILLDKRYKEIDRSITLKEFLFALGEECLGSHGQGAVVKSWCGKENRSWDDAMNYTKTLPELLQHRNAYTNFIDLTRVLLYYYTSEDWQREFCKRCINRALFETVKKAPFCHTHFGQGFLSEYYSENKMFKPLSKYPELFNRCLEDKCSKEELRFIPQKCINLVKIACDYFTPSEEHAYSRYVAPFCWEWTEPKPDPWVRNYWETEAKLHYVEVITEIFGDFLAVEKILKR